MINKGDYTEWQHRVLDERIQLDDKINKLSESLESDEFIANIKEYDRRLLTDQLACMINYREILRIRILKFDERSLGFGE